VNCWAFKPSAAATPKTSNIHRNRRNGDWTS